MIDYDKDKFNYEDSDKIILEKFKDWVGDLPLLIINNENTYNYLEYLDNEKEPILSYLGFKYSDDVIDKIIKKYKLEQSNYITDLLYEALIYGSNNKNNL
jgi:hypothetical protein